MQPANITYYSNSKKPSSTSLFRFLRQRLKVSPRSNLVQWPITWSLPPFLFLASSVIVPLKFLTSVIMSIDTADPSYNAYLPSSGSGTKLS